MSKGPSDGILWPLRNSDFRRLIISSGLWCQSMWIESVAIGWLALELTDSAWWVALIGFFRTAPMPLIGVFGPVITERYQRRRLILVTQCVILCSVFVLSMLHFHKILDYWHLATASFVTGTAWALDWPTRRSLFPDLLGKHKVVDALFLENIIQSFSRLTGPLSAGLIVNLVGTQGALNTLVISSALSVTALSGIRTKSRSPERSSGFLDSVSRGYEGLNYAFRNTTILAVLLITVAMNLLAFPYQDLLPVFARDILGTEAFGLGLLGAACGLGNILGLLLIGRIRGKRSNSWIFTVASMLACMSLIGFSQSTSFVLSLFILILVGIGQAGFSLMQSSIILIETSDAMRARVMGTLVLAIGFGPLGRIQAGAIADSFNSPFAVMAMSLIALACVSAVGFLSTEFSWFKSRKKKL